MEQTILNGSYQDLANIIERLNAKKVMIVCGQSYKRLELSNYIDNMDVEKVYFMDFTPNPIYEDVCKGVELFNAEQCEAIIAIGGGSAMDVAKCIKLFAKMDGQINYLDQPFEDTHIPLIAIPTTAGSGSESTRFSVIYYNDVKQSVLHDSIVPNYVFLVPSVLKNLPVYQKKCTLLDALCQAIESWWSVKSNEESMSYSLEAIKAIVGHAEAYINDNTDEAAEHIMLASNFAGRAINITQTTAPHAMSYKLTSIFDLPHGHSVAISLAEVWDYMIAHPEKTVDRRGSDYVQAVFQSIAEAFGCENANDGLQWYRQFLSKLEIGLPVSHAREEHLEVLTDSVNVTRLKNNPIELNRNTLHGLYERIIQR